MGMVCPKCRALQPVTSPLRALAKGYQVDRGQVRYVLDAPLGEGAMGIVWRAWSFLAPGAQRYGAPPTLVALKFMRPDLFEGSGTSPYHTFFRNEVEALRRLEHPNVVGFIDVFEHEGISVLALEFVDGDTLEAIQKRHRARRTAGGLPGLPFQRAFNYAEQLLGALAASHALGVVHRDVKPSNVLVRRDGIVKLTDYGIAAVKRKTLYVDTHGGGQELVPGTSAYMSPEQVMGNQTDGRSDVYAATVLLYELLAGTTPYDNDGKSEWLVRMNHLEAIPRPFTTWVPQAPPVLNELFNTGLAKDPNNRFQTTIAMGHAFRAALGMRDSPENQGRTGWRAQVEMAELAAQFRGGTIEIGSLAGIKLRTVQDMIMQKYRTVPITKPPTR
jgi:eukaryotic-like serine/threonine-protein kinase